METAWMWIGFNLLVLVLLALDLGVLHRKGREIGVREALLLSLGYVVLALAFGAGVYHFLGPQAGAEYITGYLIEKSLSIDNIFVFVLVFLHFSVPRDCQHKVLFWGILGALVMRASLILAGAAIIESFHWIIYVFGAFLVFTGIKMLVTVGQEPNLDENRINRFMRRHFRVTEGFEGKKFFVRRNGVLFITPLLIVLVLIEVTDVIFALDSIPAIFAITTDPFIVYTSNVFAILGLRALYFALVGIIHRFHYLKYGLSLVLVVVGAKMIVNAWFGEKIVSTELALFITSVIIGSSMLFSLLRTRRMPTEEALKDATRWWVPGSPPKSEADKQPRNDNKNGKS
ncbi:TerC/Alx family metal homeostasis membrane protein [Desulfovibrio aerotolerans]|uniref:TerC/Alx family metal homeostasis membrane protein n=1 Tax=Solidesulfovibrio aerotolerans TaxID=295255 RepID=A0A7C9INT0_9BACT|nr:TerC family protein [Solidesulfovibrio aerotolerans]MYL85365.1 TerC/Alx family metal homeostasis membrane protein [Solidesulfovibrio aerotolerans]